MGALTQVRKVRSGAQILTACDIHAIGPVVIPQLQFSLASRVELANPITIVVAESDPQLCGGFAGAEAFAGVAAPHTVIGMNPDVTVLAHIIEIDGGVAITKISRTPFGGGSGNSNGSDGQNDQQESNQSSGSFHMDTSFHSERCAAGDPFYRSAY